MDWIDLVVLCICYAGSLLLMFVLDEFGITLMKDRAELVIFPDFWVGGCRRLIGLPKSRYLRPDLAVISIFGIFAVLIGMFAVMASSPGFILTLGATPEVNKEGSAEMTAPSDDFFAQRLID